MTFIERTLRAMVHLNIGATIATAAWILWSGFVIVDPSHTALGIQPARIAAPPRPATLQERHEGHDRHDGHPGHEGHTGHRGQDGSACPCGKPPLTTRAPSPEGLASIRTTGNTA